MTVTIFSQNWILEQDSYQTEVLAIISPLRLVDDTPCHDISGICDAYKIAQQNVQLYGPTNFSPVIHHVAREASQHRHDSSNFFVLLIITKGVITDLEATRSAIVQASCLPMSIIIIGVGSEDFSFMDLLDSDDSPLTDSSGRKAERDIVQFVELQRFIRGQGTRTTWNKELLAKKVPEELPDQLVDYMKSKRTKASGSQETPKKEKIPKCLIPIHYIISLWSLFLSIVVLLPYIT